MRIGIIGAGNIGSVMAVRFSQKNRVCLFSNTNFVDEHLKVYCADQNKYLEAKQLFQTKSLKELADQSQYIFVTYPAFLFSKLAHELIPFLKKGHHLIFTPGSGGAELFFKDALSKGVTISGLQRVHCIARFIEPGLLVKESGIKKSLKVASIPSSYNSIISKVLFNLFQIPIEKFDCYLNVTLSNSNPILHTARLYSVFKDYLPNRTYDSLPLFYEDWDFYSAFLLIKLDEELYKIIEILKTKNLNLDGIKPLLEYYESNDASSLCKKIQSISAFKGILMPSIKNDDNTLSPDFSSRYFVSDFPYGLDILISFGKTLGLQLPFMQIVSNWYHVITNSDVVFNMSEFGFYNLQSIVDFYK